MKRELTYEESVKRIESIVAELEQGEIPLEQALKLFEEGVTLTRTNAALLDNAEQKVFKLIKNEEGYQAVQLEDGEI